MPQSNIATWLQFALQQIAAESYLDHIDLSSPENVTRRLLLGNNREGFPEAGFTRFTGTLAQGQAQAFVQRYQIIDQHANDATGFSATLMQEIGTNNFTLSFRSTEFEHQADGGDYERDGANGLFLTGADGEIFTDGFAFGQLAAMENYYQSTVKNSLPPGAILNVTGYSLGAHLATVFTELHAFETNDTFSFGHTYTFNGPGRGEFSGGQQAETVEADRIRKMITRLTEVLTNPMAGIDEGTPVELWPPSLNAALLAWQQDPAWDPWASGSTLSVYADARYLWAKQVVEEDFSPVSRAFSDIPRTDDAFGLITQIVGHAMQGDTEYVANSGNHAAEIRVFVEDQPDFDGFGGFFGADGAFGTTHSITLIVDSLATQELFQAVAPALTRTDIEAIFAASSNQLASGFVGTSGVAEGNTLENALDALGQLFVPNYTPTRSGRQTGDFGSLAFRNPFYEHVAAVKAAFDGATITIEPFVEMGVVGGKPKALPLVTSDQVVAEALQDTERGLAFRYALKALNPFVVIGADYQSLGHTANGALMLFNPATGFGEMTEQYLTDRAAFLQTKIELNLTNGEHSSDGSHYQDGALTYDIPASATESRHFLFGGPGGDIDLVGQSFADHLYGGGGDDILTGLGGDDYLEGNGDNDTLDAGEGRDRLFGGAGGDDLFGGAGEDRLTGGLDADELRGNSGGDIYYVGSRDGQDTIIDSDGLGTIEFDQRQLQGGVRKPGDAPNTYASLDQEFRYVLSGTTLTISSIQGSGGGLIVRDFVGGQLGLRLTAAPADPDYSNEFPVRTNDDFTVSMNGATVPAFDESDNRVLMEGPANNVVQGLGGNDQIFSDVGNDFISGDEGDDSIFGDAGHDRLFGGAGNDTLDGDVGELMPGDDYLDGGDGNDILFGGNGTDRLFGGAGNDHIEADGDASALGDGGSDYVEGGAGSDVISGGPGSDILDGGTEIDLLVGGEGDDVLYGGDGDFFDDLQGGAGGDVLTGGDGNDGLFGDGPNRAGGYDASADGTDFLDGGPGNDFLFGGGGADILVGGVGADWLAGDYTNLLLDLGSDDLLDGGEGNDLLEGGAGHDTLYAGTGDDTLYGDVNPQNGLATTGGDDYLDGEAGNDTLYGGKGDDTLLGGIGDDALFGEDGNDVLDGGGGADTLDGGAGFDVVRGGEGHDRLFAGLRAFIGDGDEGFAAFSLSAPDGLESLYGDAGDDYLDSGNEALETEDSVLVGGAGDDTYEIDSALDLVTEEADAGIDSVRAYVSYLLPDHVENVSLSGNGLTATGNGMANELRGAGDSTLDGGGGDDRLINGRWYRFGRGYDHDTIVENDPGGEPYFPGGTADAVQFTADVTPDQVSWERQGDDLVLSLDGTPDTLKIPSFYSVAFNQGNYLFSSNIVQPGLTVTVGGNPYYVAPSQVERFEFADGTVWGPGMFGATMIGAYQANTYSFDRGGGSDQILDFDFTGEPITDTLILGPSVAPSDVRLGRAGDNLTIGIEGTADRLTVQSHFAPIFVRPLFSFIGKTVSAYQLEQIRLADGTVWDALAIAGRLADLSGTEAADLLRGNARANTIAGLDGSDWLEGFGGDDLLDGGMGNDTLLGGEGSDTYVFRLGDGMDTIEDVTLAGEKNRIQFGAGIVLSDLTLTYDEAAQTLTIQVGSSTDRLRLIGFDPTGASGSVVVETMTFADGSTVNLAEQVPSASNHAPTVAMSPADQTAREDTAFSLTLPASTFADVDLIHGDELTYSAALADGAALPGWLGFDADSRTFSGVPLNSDVGTMAITVTATDQGSLSASTGFTLAIQNVNDAPMVAAPIADQSAAEDSAFTLTIPDTTFTDEDVIHGDHLTYNAMLGDGNPLPAWLTFNSASQTFSGTPGAGDAGSYQVSVTATDSESLTATGLFFLTVSGPLPQTIMGTAGSDVLTGGRGDDTLTGLGGSDLLDGGAGADAMAGGEGSDIYVVDDPADVVTELESEGIDTVLSTATTTLGDNVELLFLTGAAAIDGIGNALGNGLTGNDAANRLDGGAGADVMAGLAGDDTYVVENSGDVVVELAGQGIDTVESRLTYYLTANVENLTLTGSAAINGIGNGLSNILTGNSAANTLVGGAGNDIYVVGAGDTVVESGSGGTDTVQSSVSWTLGSNVEHLTLIGSAVINGTGNGSANLLTGNSANNMLSGAGGADTLRGGWGNDTLIGGGGNDTFLVGRGDGQDLVQDNSGSADKLLYDADIDPLDLVISRQAGDLRLSLHGSTDSVTIQNWYGGSSNRIETIQTGNGHTLLSTQVDQLIQAMASFSLQTGLTWDQAIEQRPQDVQTVLAASWQ